jgi:transcriptional regulator with XRE-family HTH domain
MIGNKLKAARLRARLTQAQLAAAAGLDQSAVSQIERGIITEPRTATLKALAAALGVSAADLDPGLGEVSP